MKKRVLTYIIVAIFILALGASLLTGCSSITESAESVANSFVNKLVAKDYSGAFDYVYVLTSDVKTRDQFTARFNNIYEALEFTDVKLIGRQVVEKQSETDYTLTYTLQFSSDLLGDVTYDYTADIVSGPQGYSILYTPSLILPTLEEGDKVRTASQTGARGEIFSADGAVLAKNDYAQSVYLDLEKNPDIEEVKSFLTANFSADAEKIQKKYDNAVEKGYPLEVLLTYPKNTLTDEQKQAISEVNGLGVDEERLSPIRYYPYKDDAAHIIGYMGSPSEEQLEQDDTITENSSVGKAGLEQQLEQTLRGKDGRIIYIEDEKGNQKEILYEDSKTDGTNVQLSIDSRTQQKAYTLMAANLKDDEGGAVIVMDYATGAVESMVSYPSFDNNLFNFPLDPAVWDYYSNEDSGNPLLNRATQSTFMPGSAFKPFSSVPAINAGVLNADSVPPIKKTPPHSEGNETGSYSWTPDIEGWHSGAIYSKDVAKSPGTYEMAMKSSDNIYFAYYALQTTLEPFKSYLESIGIGGEPPAFDLPVKTSSMVSGDEESIDWLDWLARTGYGTGQLVISPLQLATMYTALENNGNMVNPTLVSRTFTIDENENETTVEEKQVSYYKENTMSQNVIDIEKPALRRVMVDGTGYNALLGNKFNIYGKTGTAQVGENSLKREVNWVIALNEDDGKLYLVVVETAVNEGNVPKLAILRGLVDEESYDAALQTVTPGPTSGSGDDSGTQDDDTTGGDTGDSGTQGE